MARFAQTDGPFGPMVRQNQRPSRFTQVANPGVYARFPRIGQTIPNEQPATITNAGKPGIGCCSECSSSARQR